MLWKRLITHVAKHKWEYLLILALMVLAGLAHGWNMLHYPYLENDEATYVSQAWSFVTEGKLAPYTYWYDHAPAGWMFMGLWLKLAGGIHAFGGLIYSGRVFMLILHIASSLLLYLIAVRLTKRKIAGIIAVIIFALSPLELYFGRRVLLDNIMTFWMLLSIWFAVIAQGRMKYVTSCAVALGIAILSKENAFVIAPALMYWLYTTSAQKNRKYLFAQWFFTVVGIVSVYFLYALLKNELFPTGTLLGGMHPHVSLLQTLKDQGSRGTFAWPWESHSDFYQGASAWIIKDKFLIVAGALASILGIVLAIKDRSMRFVAILLVCMWAFLGRGKLVIVFYIVPLIPLFALMIGMLMAYPLKWIASRKTAFVYTAAVVLGFLTIYLHTPFEGWHSDETSNQQAAVDWITMHVPQDAHIAIDDYAFPELRSNYNYVNADWTWKIEYDPAISAKLDNNWENIQYILLTHEVLKQVRDGTFPLVRDALLHADLVGDFRTNTRSHIDVSHFISTNGDWAQVYKVKSRERILTQDSWTNTKANFMKSYGQSTDPAYPDSTTLALQATFMKTALAENDTPAFDGLWSWSRDHLQHRPADALLSSSTADGQADIAANADVATSLLEAATKFKREDYRVAAGRVMTDLWRQHAVAPTFIELSDLRQFAAADPTHPWSQIADSEYANLAAQAATAPLVSSAGGNTIPEADLYRLTSDLAVESESAHDPRAKLLLTGISGYFQSHLPVSALYHRDGSIATGSSAGFAAAALAASQIALGGSGAASTYQHYLAIKPGSPLLQLDIDDLLTQADHQHVPLIKRS